MITTLRMLWRCRRNPVFCRAILGLKLSNLLLEATIFRLECDYVILDLRLRVQDFRVKFSVLVEESFAHEKRERVATPNDPKLSDCGGRRAGCGEAAGAGWAKVAGW
jgi:hypothetical protein